MTDAEIHALQIRLDTLKENHATVVKLLEALTGKIERQAEAAARGAHERSTQIAELTKEVALLTQRNEKLQELEKANKAQDTKIEKLETKTEEQAKVISSHKVWVQILSATIMTVIGAVTATVVKVFGK